MNYMYMEDAGDPRTTKITLPYFFDYKMENFSFRKNRKNLDSSFKKNL